MNLTSCTGCGIPLPYDEAIYIEGQPSCDNCVADCKCGRQFIGEGDECEKCRGEK
jgi:hypothetical protein